MRTALALLVSLACLPRAAAAAQAPLPALPVVVHVAQLDGVPVVDDGWVHAAIDEANRIYAPQHLSVRLEQIVPLTAPPLAELRTREDRDALGAANAPGVVNVYIVAYLADIDASGERRGVHWRVRGGRGRHLCIVSRVAGRSTMAHEMGHFFGLPHTHVVDDLMSYERRDDDPFLSDVQGATMRDRARCYLRSRELRAAEG